ncbi:MACPF domain-containing protein [Apostasia shenzhenica]|uniref:MACPF domain-containing protein n=1 Tax=Apostasia shenzhenica TaxID=1088818 RepID=A0A2I0BEA8_9ASPA|nr:MACPF domain-containing protein [Apostasia shenzhenica]
MKNYISRSQCRTDKLLRLTGGRFPKHPTVSGRRSFLSCWRRRLRRRLLILGVLNARLSSFLIWFPIDRREGAGWWEMEGGQPEPVELRALRSLGLGFDLTSDFRLRFAKGYPGRRLVQLDEERTGDLVFPGGFAVRGVSKDIGCDKGDRIRFCSDVLEFNQMSELLNQKSLIQGKVPSGYFNALFDLSGAWLDDSKENKHLAFDGYFISLYNLHLKASPLILCDEVKKAVPSNWEPAALSRFIRVYGTHIIVEMAIGGQDMICVRQNHVSTISPADLKVHLQDLGNFLFSDGSDLSPPNQIIRSDNNKVPEVFVKILQSNNLQLATHSETSSKDGLTIVCSKRGGDPFISSHSKWLQTVLRSPEAILFKFVPVTSLLTGIPGSGYLSHAINLYLRYKPDADDLQYFLEFQVPRQWAPLYNELPLGPQHPQQKKSYPTLQFTLLGPKLRIKTSQVSSSSIPVVGLRLFLEGPKCNQLAVHVQHLSNLPSMLESATSSRFSEWQSSEDSDPRFIEPIRWKSHSLVCTAAVKHNPKWFEIVSDGVFVVTGVQLVTSGRCLKKCLHLRLLFTHIPNCSIQKTEWAQHPSNSRKGSFLSTISTTLSSTFTRREYPPLLQPEPSLLNSGVYPDGPPVPVQSQKLLRFVDMIEIVRGPNDVPGHWLVTAAKLVTEGGKIGLRVKFALLNFSSETDRD